MTRAVRGLLWTLGAGALGLAPSSLAAQGATQPAGSNAASAAPPVVAAPVAPRASWFSDRRPLRVGDIITVVVDETANASETQTSNATLNRQQQMALNLTVDSASRLGPKKGFNTSFGNTSKNEGQAKRAGDLTATISVRVTALEPTGNAKIEGEKTVAVDGRNQVIKLSGVIRPEDLTGANTVPSSRIAEAVISYKGKKFGPARGILGNLLAIFWP
jgi:flagellar L-ring protein precursor FlgH